MTSVLVTDDAHNAQNKALAREYNYDLVVLIDPNALGSELIYCMDPAIASTITEQVEIENRRTIGPVVIFSLAMGEMPLRAYLEKKFADITFEEEFLLEDTDAAATGITFFT